MSILKYDYDVSIDKRVELYLFWIPNGNQVDVAVYIHKIEKDKKAQLLSRNPPDSSVDLRYLYATNFQGDIPELHTEYFEYTISGPPQNIVADILNSGGASKANAIAL
ncbi:MAG: hypothetical protein R2750_11935 [Bacteroidales bacterium]